MGYLNAFAISGSGLTVEKARHEAIALNLANVHSTKGRDGSAFLPLRVISAAKRSSEFQTALSTAEAAQLRGAEVVEWAHVNAAPRLAYEPGHPDADAKGFVAYPGINPVTEMVELIATVRAYEANLAALSAAKAMALRTLELGGGS
jgi:flagellar basal-body rod protein FlgC